MRTQLRLWKGLGKEQIEKKALSAFKLLPATWRDTITAWGLGDLTSDDPLLRVREVPTITIDEITSAMKQRQRASFR